MRRSSASTRQSGKGGVAYVLDREHGLDLPKTMHPQVGKCIYDLADKHGRELTPDEIRDAFFEHFANLSEPLYRDRLRTRPPRRGAATSHCKRRPSRATENPVLIEGIGNGPINAFVHALETTA